MLLYLEGQNKAQSCGGFSSLSGISGFTGFPGEHNKLPHKNRTKGSRKILFKGSSMKNDS